MNIDASPDDAAADGCPTVPLGPFGAFALPAEWPNIASKGGADGFDMPPRNLPGNGWCLRSLATQVPPAIMTHVALPFRRSSSCIRRTMALAQSMGLSQMYHGRHAAPCSATGRFVPHWTADRAPPGDSLWHWGTVARRPSL